MTGAFHPILVSFTVEAIDGATANYLLDVSGEDGGWHAGVTGLHLYATGDDATQTKYQAVYAPGQWRAIYITGSRVTDDQATGHGYPDDDITDNDPADLAVTASSEHVNRLHGAISGIGLLADIDFPATAKGGVYGYENVSRLLDRIDVLARTEKLARGFASAQWDRAEKLLPAESGQPLPDLDPRQVSALANGVASFARSLSTGPGPRS